VPRRDGKPQLADAAALALAGIDETLYWSARQRPSLLNRAASSRETGLRTNVTPDKRLGGGSPMNPYASFWPAGKAPRFLILIAPGI